MVLDDLCQCMLSGPLCEGLSAKLSGLVALGWMPSETIIHCVLEGVDFDWKWWISTLTIDD